MADNNYFLQDATPEEIKQALLLGIQAQSQREQLEPELERAYAQAYQPLRGVTGQGFAAQGPTMLEGIANIVGRHKGGQRLHELQTQDNQLREQLLQAQQAAVLRGMQEKPRSVLNMGRGFVYDQNTGESFQLPGYANSMEAELNAQTTARQRAADTKQRIDEEKRQVLTAPQIQSGLDKLGEKMKGPMTIGASIAELDNLLMPYTVGGESEGENIPGVGLMEGGRGKIGDVIRWGQGQESQAINSVWNSLVSGQLREQAGAAQTLTETNNVLRSLAAQDITSEEAMLAGYERLRQAYANDLQRIASTTHPQILERFLQTYPDGASPFDSDLTPLQFPNVEIETIPKGPQSRQAQRRQEREARAERAAQERLEASPDYRAQRRKEQEDEIKNVQERQKQRMQRIEELRRKQAGG